MLPKIILTLAVFILCSGSLSAAPKYAPDEVLVKFKPGKEAAISGMKTQFNATQAGSIRKLGYHRLRLPKGSDIEKTLEKLRANPNVAYAGRNGTLRIAFSLPDDPVFYDGDWLFGIPQWGMYNDGDNNGNGGTFRADIKAPEAWEITTGSPNVPIAVIDTGIEFDHPDLIDKIWSAPGEIADNGIDDDHNGFIDDVHGWDFVNSDNDPSDDNDVFHGTFVSGIAAARGNNGEGIAGVAWDCPVLPIKVIDASGYGLESDAAEGIVYAVDLGVKVINMSLSGENLPALEDAVNYAWNHGAICIVASGNEGVSTPSYPASYANALAVGASNEQDKRCTAADWLSGGSNYGDYLDVVAPGSWIVSCSGFGDYYTSPGTSAACPFVAGIAALIWSEFPTWTNAQVFNQIIRTADDTETSGYDIFTGWGRVNAYRALTETFTDLPSISAARQAGLNSFISLKGRTVSAGSGQIPNRIYVQEEDRSSGILLSFSGGPAPTGLAIGDKVNIFGKLGMTSGEVAIINPTVSKVGAGTPPRPLAMRNTSVGGSAHLDQQAVVNQYSFPREMASGLNNIGMLVRTMGKVTAVGFDWFYLDDKSHLDDGTGYEGILVQCGALQRPGLNKWVTVTGISSCDIPSGSPVARRILRPRVQSDLQVH